RITIESEVADERGYLTQAFARVGIEPEAVLVAPEPTPAEIAEAAERAAAADATVLFLYDAHLYPSNRALLDAVTARARALADERRAVERHGHRHAPPPAATPRHERRDDGAELAVDRVRELDLPCDRFGARALHAPGECHERQHRGGRDQYDDDDLEQCLHGG